MSFALTGSVEKEGWLLETTKDGAEWQRWLGEMPEAGPRDGFEYASAATILDRGEPVCARFTSESGRLVLPLIQRPIARRDRDLCDVVSPYDLGGYLFTPGSAVSAVTAEFGRAWARWCSENGVVTEFLRLHPLRSWADALSNESELHQMQVVVDLRGGYESALSGYAENARRSVLKGRRAGVRAERHDGRGAPALFHALYAPTMRRLNAPRFYDFPPEFFERVFDRVPGAELRVAFGGGSEPAAAAVFLHDGSDVFYFLGASDPVHWERRPNHVLFDDAILAFAAAGKRWLHLGGGSASLMRFKSGFSRQTVPYRVRRRIHDAAAYEALVAEARAHGRPVTPGFFPAYRSDEFVALASG